MEIRTADELVGTNTVQRARRMDAIFLSQTGGRPCVAFAARGTDRMRYEIYLTLDDLDRLTQIARRNEIHMVERPSGEVVEMPFEPPQIVLDRMRMMLNEKRSRSRRDQARIAYEAARKALYELKVDTAVLDEMTNVVNEGNNL